MACWQALVDLLLAEYSDADAGNHGDITPLQQLQGAQVHLDRARLSERNLLVNEQNDIACSHTYVVKPRGINFSSPLIWQYRLGRLGAVGCASTAHC